MELILINENKLKITLSECDMRQYELDCGTVDYDSTETRRAFWSILDEVKHKTGFDAARQKVFIQLYPSKGGGCEMYVTKLGARNGDNDLPGEEERAHRLQPLHRRRAAYSFDDLCGILRVCRQLSVMGHAGESEAWRSACGRYYLILEEAEENAYLPLHECTFIREFGKSENLRNTLMMLCEHGRLICKGDAVEKLGAI